MHISVKPQYFNRDDMVALARQLNRDYPREERLDAIIFDNYRAARDFVPHAHSPTYKRDWAALRGSYHLDRSTGEEYISFSPDPKKPRDEVKIELRIPSR